MSPPERREHSLAVWCALLVTVLWSSSWVLVRVGLDDESLRPITFAGLSLDPPRVWAGGCGRVHQKGLLSWDARDVQSHVHRKHGRHVL